MRFALLLLSIVMLCTTASADLPPAPEIPTEGVLHRISHEAIWEVQCPEGEVQYGCYVMYFRVHKKPCADTTGDGAVGSPDALAVTGQWGTLCPIP
jgi:hypothetical protein